MYQWKLLNHVSREHNMTLKPAHLSYKCTVCTATFGMYKQFENHVYSAHSTVAKKTVDNKKNSNSLSSNNSSGLSGRSIGGSGLTVTSTHAGDSLLKPLKINDEITIIPQPASRNRTIEIESHVIGMYKYKRNWKWFRATIKTHQSFHFEILFWLNFYLFHIHRLTWTWIYHRLHLNHVSYPWIRW